MASEARGYVWREYTQQASVSAWEEKYGRDAGPDVDGLIEEQINGLLGAVEIYAQTAEDPEMMESQIREIEELYREYSEMDIPPSPNAKYMALGALITAFSIAIDTHARNGNHEKVKENNANMKELTTEIAANRA